MVKKGKYKLLSHFIEDYLLFYKSLNKNKKFIAFSIFECFDFHPSFNILTDYLKKRFLNYFSIQVDSNESSKIYFVLSFQDKDKDAIVKIFHLLRQKLQEIKSDITFLKKDFLNQKFFNIITQSFNINIEITKSTDSLILLNEKIPTVLQLYTIDFGLIEKENFFIKNFMSLLNDYNKKGNLIFNIKRDMNREISLSTILLEPRNVGKDLLNIEEEINNFYGYCLLKKQNLEIKHVWNLIWRFVPFNNSILLENVLQLFRPVEERKFKNLIDFNLYFEENLMSNQIQFKRINSNLLFINPKSLFFTFNNVNFELIFKILKKYVKKYFIYILVLDKNEYRELLKIEKIKLLEHIQVMSPNDFNNFDIDTLK